MTRGSRVRRASSTQPRAPRFGDSFADKTRTGGLLYLPPFNSHYHFVSAHTASRYILPEINRSLARISTKKRLKTTLLLRWTRFSLPRCIQFVIYAALANKAHVILSFCSIIIIYYVYRTQSTKYKKYTHKTYNRHQEVQIKSTA